MPPEALVAAPPEVAALHADLDVLRDGVPVVRDVHVELEIGGAMGIVGRNGAGKTTLLGGILGFLRTRGPLRAFGEDVATWPTHRRATYGLALVPQGRRLFAELTVAENLRAAEVSPTGDGPRFDVLELFPNLDALLDRRAGVLSGGQQQQVAIARALLRRPRLLLLDEPTEGLAPSVVDEVASALTVLREGGLTLLIAEQRLDVVSDLCDRVAVMRGGEVDAQGPASAPEIHQHLLTL